ncbi:MAG: alpha/beta fold hydrolase [Acidobacteria bacterium]|nr:alpha/beta fold hydrolase [Acidobacteriota bacterium]
MCHADALQLAYDLNDLRPALLLLHPFPFDRRIWAPQVEELSAEYPVLAVDLPGFGDSPPARSASLDAWADRVDQLLEATVGGRPVVVAGLSMGGYVALRLAARHPERLEGMILADTRAHADTPEARAGREQAAALVRSQGVGAIAEGLLEKLFSPRAEPGLVQRAREVMLEQSPEAVATALTAMRDRPDSTAILGQIAVPTLVIVGAEDALTPPSDAEAMYQRIPRAWLVRIPGAGHLSNLEAPEELNAAVRGFLAAL